MEYILSCDWIQFKNDVEEKMEKLGSAGYRFAYVIYDYDNNTILETPNKMWIAQFYNEDMIYNWEDKKYSVDAYKTIIHI